MLAAGANAVAAVRSPKTSTDLQDLKLQYPEALTIIAMDAGVFPSVKVRLQQMARTADGTHGTVSALHK